MPRFVIAHRTFLVWLPLFLGACSEHSPQPSNVLDDATTTIRYNVSSPMLRDVPWPNDSLCWNRDTTNGPCRPNIPNVNLSPTLATWVGVLNDTRGWSTTADILVPFRRASDAFTGPAIDLTRLLSVQQNLDFSDDAVYVIDLETGIPILLDFDDHLSSVALMEPFALDPSDPLRGEPSLVVETLDERYDYATAGFDSARTEDGQISGAPVYARKWDYDSDGHLDVPNYQRGRQCSPAIGGTSTLERDRCLADNVIHIYDPHTDQLYLRPRAPLREHATYAVVITKRLVDNLQRAVRSPFASVYHTSDEYAAKRVESLLSDSARQDYFGSLAGTGLSQVAFLWSFTTSAPVAQLGALSASLSATNTRLTVDDAVDLTQECDEGTPRELIYSLFAKAFGLSAPEQQAIESAWSNVAAIRTGTLTHPDWLTLEGGSLRARTTSGTSLVDVPYLVTLPKASSDMATVKAVVVSHDFGTNRLDGLRWAGHLARFGLATIQFDRNGSTRNLDASSIRELTSEAKTRCATLLLDALLAQRSDNDWTTSSPSGPDLVTTSSLWRIGAVELSELAARLTTGDSGLDLPTLELVGYLGQGEGAAVASLAATLTPKPPAVVLVDPTTSPDRAWARGATWGDPPEARLALFGPRVAGVPQSSLDSSETRCSASQASLRLITPDTGTTGAELDCLNLLSEDDSRFIDGATVIATNLRSGAKRCVTMPSSGSFSLGIPAEDQDDLEIAIFAGLTATQNVGRDSDCELVDSSTPPDYLFDTSQHSSNSDLPQTRFGLGLERQSSEFRSALALADSAFTLANPKAFLAALGRQLPGTKAQGVVIVVSPGDPRVTPDEGLSMAVATGLVPSLLDDTLDAYPECADDTTPTLLRTSLRFPTAEQALADGHLAEGAPRLQRHAPSPLTCSGNYLETESLADLCHPECSDTSDCPPGTLCSTTGRCAIENPTVERCADSLYDLDALADDLTGTNASRAPYPVRLGRYSGLATSDNLVELWQPRTTVKGVAEATPLQHPDWALSALALPLVSPFGSHGIPTDNLCQAFRYGTYLPHVFGRYLSTRGHDYAPILSWDTQTCLATTETPATCK